MEVYLRCEAEDLLSELERLSFEISNGLREVPNRRPRFSVCIEIFGGYARVVYWHWRYHRGEWVKATLDVAIVRPIFSFTSPFETWCDCVVRVPEPETPVMSSRSIKAPFNRRLRHK
jgi:hypothetical protein